MKRLTKPERLRLANSLVAALTQHMIGNDQFRQEVAIEAGLGSYPEGDEMVAVLIDEMASILERMEELYTINASSPSKEFVGDPIPLEIVD
ncbi:MAG: hypothetical protein H6618_06445 [Deltaproteobacteria bacterium]|nr:hypothetical protein [Deltaproteobacteria bacterium]